MPPASASDASVSIALFARAPVPGEVKTRLVMTLGVDGAATLQERLIRRTVDAAMAAEAGPITLWVDPHERHPLFAELARRRLTVARQPAGDHGARILAATAQGPVLIVGTDCPALTAEHIRDAAAALREGSDAVLVPADDNGYAMLGLRQPVPDLFCGMSWNRDGVAADIRERLTRHGLTWREPAQLWNVDRATDVRRMRRAGFRDLLAGLDHDFTPLRPQPVGMWPAAAPA